jgi:putative FmdB family regulatory protein
VPTYEYECDKCRRVFEVRQRISEPALTTCDACGGAVRRLLSPAPFILKGDGWYVTDYPSESRKKALEAEKKAPSAATDKAGDSKAGGSKDASTATATSPTESAKSASSGTGSTPTTASPTTSGS